MRIRPIQSTVCLKKTLFVWHPVPDPLHCWNRPDPDPLLSSTQIQPDLEPLPCLNDKANTERLRDAIYNLTTNLKLVEFLLRVLGRLAPVFGPPPPELRLLGRAGELGHLLLHHSSLTVTNTTTTSNSPTFVSNLKG